MTALQVETHLRKGVPNANLERFMGGWRRVVPVGVEVGERLYRTDQLQALAKEKASTEEVIKLVRGLISQEVAGSSFTS